MIISSLVIEIVLKDSSSRQDLNVWSQDQDQTLTRGSWDQITKTMHLGVQIEINVLQSTSSKGIVTTSKNKTIKRLLNSLQETLTKADILIMYIRHV